jgi:hypothetical protein
MNNSLKKNFNSAVILHEWQKRFRATKVVMDITKKAKEK